MNEAILCSIAAAFEEICPFEVRLAHRVKDSFGGRRYIYIEDKGVSCERLQNEPSCTRYFVDAGVSVTAAVPISSDTAELSRIAAAYILPVMTELGFCITGFSQSSIKDDNQRSVHKMELLFRIKGIYTIPAAQEVL